MSGPQLFSPSFYNQIAGKFALPVGGAAPSAQLPYIKLDQPASAQLGSQYQGLMRSAMQQAGNQFSRAYSAANQPYQQAYTNFHRNYVLDAINGGLGLMGQMGVGIGDPTGGLGGLV